MRGCARGEGERKDRGARGRVKTCDRCGRVLTVAIMARHQSGCAAKGAQARAKPLTGADRLGGGGVHKAVDLVWSLLRIYSQIKTMLIP